MHKKYHAITQHWTCTYTHALEKISKIVFQLTTFISKSAIWGFCSRLPPLSFLFLYHDDDRRAFKVSQFSVIENKFYSLSPPPCRRRRIEWKMEWKQNVQHLRRKFWGVAWRSIERERMRARGVLVVKAKNEHEGEKRNENRTHIHEPAVESSMIEDLCFMRKSMLCFPLRKWIFSPSVHCFGNYSQISTIFDNYLIAIVINHNEASHSRTNLLFS